MHKMTFTAKYRIILLITSIAAFLVQDKMYSSEGPEEKPVICSVEILPNYLWHVFALSNTWNKDESLYKKEYIHTIPQPDIDFIYNNRDYIAWGNGKSGKFTKLLFFIPLQKKSSFPGLCLYLDEAIYAAVTSNWDSFAAKYCIDKHDSDIVSAYIFTRNDMAVFKSICEILKNNFTEFRKTVWQDIKPVLQTQADSINSSFAGTSTIEKWEKNLGMKYSAFDFVPVLTYANAVDNLPSANNLSFSRNNFGVSPGKTQYTINIIQHEIGIYVLMPAILELMQDTDLQSDYIQNNGILYQAIESFIEQKKAVISGESDTWKGNLFSGGSFDFQWFFNYYKNNMDTYKTAALIKNAVLTYENEHK